MSIVLRIGAVRGKACVTDHLNFGQDAGSSDTDAQDIPVPEEVHHRPSQTYPGCFGLPYQDHNYGAPPPMSPTPPKSPPTPVPKVNGSVELEEEAKVPAVSNEEEVVEDSITRCICGFLHDDGYMICCDKCSVWQHIDCMEIDRNNIPENYCCEICEPRKLDFDRAKMIQLKRKEELDTSATDTDPEEPANALASLGRKPVQPKPKVSKQRRVSKAGARLLKTGRLAKSQQFKREKKLKLTKKEKENVKDASKKQKVGKTAVAKQKKMKKKLSTFLTQNKADSWYPLSGPFCSVDDTNENEYSTEILEFLSHAKTNGIHSPHSIGVFPEELLVRLYQVSDFGKNRKGLEATDLIAPGRAVIEFKGKVLLREHYKFPDTVKNWAEAHVLFYSKFEGLDLCIDASAFGGDARFIRRSCTPNAEMCHIIDNGNLHFIVRAKKEIVKGSEITIPFDFSYQEAPSFVECACGRINCPVAKFWKKMKLAQKSPEKPKRKRQASGEGRGVRRNSQTKNSPIKTSAGNKSPVKTSPLKNTDAVMPLTFSLDEPSLTVDTHSYTDRLQAVSPIAKQAPIPRRSSRAISDVEEKDVKPLKLAHAKEAHGKASSSVTTAAATCTSTAGDMDTQMDTVESAAADLSTQLGTELETDSAGECPKKLTREERKMMAIMKTFEKMAKREERRKEALARLDKKHFDVKDEPHVSEACTGSSSESCPEKASEQAALPAAISQCLEMESKVVIKTEDPQPVVDSPVKSIRHRRVKRKRRNSRAMSALEPLCSSPVQCRPQPAPTVPDLVQSAEEEVKEEELDPLPPPVIPHHTATIVSPECDPAADLEASASYIFHKKRKHLLSDSTGSRMERHADSIDEHMREEEMFVSYSAGPRNVMEHIQRRNSTSGNFGRASDSSSGNAKKRWLRQAINETTPVWLKAAKSSPQHVPVDNSPPAQPCVQLPAATASTSTSLPSPTGSPSSDFVTPLKKRRLAPEFLPSMLSAAHSTPYGPESTQPSTMVSPTPNVTATCSTVTTPTAADHSRAALKGATRLPMKATCLFGRRNRNGFVGSTENKASNCDDSVPVPESCTSPLRTGSDGAGVLPGLEELSADGLSSSTALQTVGCTTTHSTASATISRSADSAETNECGAHSHLALATSSSVACFLDRHDSAPDVPMVDSSGSALDGEGSGSRLGECSDNVGVCSSDNEVSVECVHSMDSDHQAERASRQDSAEVAESSSMSPGAGLHHLQDQDEDISESQSVEERMEVDEGNEASGSVSGSEELVPAHPEDVSARARVDCLVNSSQDSPRVSRHPGASCSPSQGEAECNTSSLSQPAPDRTVDSRHGSVCDSARRAVSSAPSGGAAHERERGGVSSAQDVAAVSSLLCVHESETLASSDVECGPSSSTQALRSRQQDDELVCNSSDVTGSEVVRAVCEESNVDSTTQSSRRLVSDLNHCDTADSQLQTVSSEESCCDSNSDDQALMALSADGGAGVSSSGPADSQSNEVAESGQGTPSASSSTVSSSTTASGSLFRSSYVDSTASLQVCGSTLASTSTAGLSTMEAADHPGPTATPSSSQSTPSASPCVSTNSGSGMDGPSVETSSGLLVTSGTVAMPPALESREDGVCTSDQPFSSMSSSSTAMPELCEASTSSSRTGSSWRLFEDGSAPIASSLQGQVNGEVTVSSMPGTGAGALDSQSEGVAVSGGDVAHTSFVSSVSEDSSGSSSVSNPCATVSSSEAQAAPAAKRKVSLSEYRSRRKDKAGSTSTSTSSTSPKSSSDGRLASHRASLDSSISLAPLPLFEPITINKESREHREAERERNEKPMSLSDRLRIEFGLETTSEDEDKASSSGLRKSSRDIPPPPPPPPNGVLGGVGMRLSTNTGPRPGAAENDDDGRQTSVTSLAGKVPSATATTTSGFGSAGPSGSGASQPSTARQPGYSWLAKLHSAVAGPSSAPLPPHPPHQFPSSTTIFSAGMTQQPTQRPHSPYNGPASGGGGHLVNGSHHQAGTAAAAFSAGAMYPSLQGPSTQRASFATATSGKPQQAPPPPPPPPSSAYPPYIAQSRTHPHTSPLGGGQQPPLPSRGSASQTQRSGAVGNGNGGRSRHASADPSSNHVRGRYHYDQFSHSKTVKQKGFHGPDRSRH